MGDVGRKADRIQLVVGRVAAGQGQARHRHRLARGRVLRRERAGSRARQRHRVGAVVQAVNRGRRAEGDRSRARDRSAKAGVVGLVGGGETRDRQGLLQDVRRQTDRAELIIGGVDSGQGEARHRHRLARARVLRREGPGSRTRERHRVGAVVQAVGGGRRARGDRGRARDCGAEACVVSLIGGREARDRQGLLSDVSRKANRIQLVVGGVAAGQAQARHRHRLARGRVLRRERAGSRARDGHRVGAVEQAIDVGRRTGGEHRRAGDRGTESGVVGLVRSGEPGGREGLLGDRQRTGGKVEAVTEFTQT